MRPQARGKPRRDNGKSTILCQAFLWIPLVYPCPKIVRFWLLATRWAGSVGLIRYADFYLELLMVPLVIVPESPFPALSCYVCSHLLHYMRTIHVVSRRHGTALCVLSLKSLAKSAHSLLVFSVLRMPLTASIFDAGFLKKHYFSP